MAVHIRKKGNKPDPKKHLSVVKRAMKGDTAGLILNGSDAFPEDSFEGIYFAGGITGGAAPILEPFFKPGTLYALCSQNNTLMQCVEAMEVNVDGTGHTFVLRPGVDTDDNAEKQMLTDFFNEPYPGQTMIGLRRQLRRDLEATGNGYLQVLRNLDGEVMAINVLDALYMRLIRVDDPVMAKKTITRKGKEVEVELLVRERRFVQMVNGKRIYFKEFGASRNINARTGEWIKPDDKKTPVTDYGSEILHFIVNREPKTPYGAPRWLNEMPSVLGSRKAEEFNLEYFDAGGLPPVLVLVQGGYLGDTVKDELKQHLGGKGGAKHRAAIVEAVSSSGSMDSAGTVKVTVERFGTERMNDAMFQTYDDKTGEHVREAFRLPPLFIGKAVDYNFATAYTGYMVAEAQVFGPERTEFDNMINTTICRALGAKTYLFRSTPLTLTDVQNQIKALSLVGNLLVSPEETVQKFNEITGLDMHYEPVTNPALLGSGLISRQVNQTAKIAPAIADRTSPVDPQTQEEVAAAQSGSRVATDQPAVVGARSPGSFNSGKTHLKSVKSEDMSRLLKLANEWAVLIGLDSGPRPSDAERDRIKEDVRKLDRSETKLFTQLVASKSLAAPTMDPEGLAELCGCTLEEA